MILNGDLPSRPLYILYIGYDLFLSIFLYTGLGIPGIMTAQLLLSLVAAYCLYLLTAKIYDSKAGFLAALFYVSFPRIHIYNFTVLTESFFTSMIIISLFCLVISNKPWQKVCSGILLFFTSTIRPHGFFLLLAFFVYILYSFFSSKRYKTLIFVSTIITLTVLFSVKTFGEKESEIFKRCAVNLMDGYAFLNTWKILEFKGEPLSFQGDKNVLLTIILFILTNPFYLLKLWAMKISVFFLFIRPFFSKFHNIVSIVTLVPLYILGVIGLIQKTEFSGVKLMIVVFCLLQAVSAALIIVEPDGRDLLPILPLIFIFSASGAQKIPLVKRIISKASGRC